MKSINAVVFGLFAAVLTLAGCQRAEAVDFSLGYQDNQVIDKEGVVASIGTQTKNGVRVGVNTFSTEDKLGAYGVYVASPIRLEGSKVFITPQSQLDHYRETDSVVGSLGAGVEYHFTDTLRLEGVALAHKGFNDTDVKGETYTVKLTKTF